MDKTTFDKVKVGDYFCSELLPGIIFKRIHPVVVPVKGPANIKSREVNAEVACGIGKAATEKLSSMGINKGMKGRFYVDSEVEYPLPENLLSLVEDFAE